MITLYSPLDMHLHLRDADMLKSVARFSSNYFSGALIMPNIIPSLTTIKDLLAYKNRIEEVVKNDSFEPFMTLFFKKEYDFEFLKEAKKYVKAIKLYPDGVTINSKGGVKSLNIDDIGVTLEAMSKLDIILSVHGETDGFVLDREKEFGRYYKELAKTFPKLKIVMEHITDRHSIELLEEFDNLYATITLHHLLITLDDVIGGSLNPHLFCKPIAKREEDRKALLELALNAHPKVMFGSDSAPHPKSKKESLEGAAGIFSSPILLPALCELFEEHNKLENLQNFISNNAQKIYNIKPISKEIKLIKKEFIIPQEYAEIVPMFAGKRLKWSYYEDTSS